MFRPLHCLLPRRFQNYDCEGRRLRLDFDVGIENKVRGPSSLVLTRSVPGAHLHTTQRRDDFGGRRRSRSPPRRSRSRTPERRGGERRRSRTPERRDRTPPPRRTPSPTRRASAAPPPVAPVAAAPVHAPNTPQDTPVAPINAQQ